MKKIITIALLLASVFSQAQRFDWVSTAGWAGVANSFSGAIAIARDSQDNIYTLDVANGQQRCQGVTAEIISGFNTTFLYKFNASGKLQYIKPIGLNFFPLNIQVGENDNLYVLGSLTASGTLQVNDSIIPAVANRNYILKFDTSGKLLWTAFNNVSFGPWSAACMLQYHDNHIYFQSASFSITKLDTSGKYITTLAADSYLTNGVSSSISFAGSGVFSNGDLLFTAVSRGTLKYDTITLVPIVETGSVSLLMLRTSDSLTVTWAKYVNGVGNPAATFIPVTIGNDDGIYVGVEVNSTLTAGSDVITNPGPGSTNYIDGILKLDDSGTPVWLKSVTTNAHAWSILNNPDGSGVFCGGEFTGALTLGNFTINTANGRSFIAKIDYNGTFKNAFAFVNGIEMGSEVKSLATNNAGDFFVGGKLSSRNVPTFSCVPRDANVGLYVGKFTEEPDVAPQPSITRSGIELTASPAFAGKIQWYLNGDTIPGATNQSYTAAENGDYTVSYSFIPSCVSTSAKTSVLTVGLSENKSNRFAVYPNPSNGLFTLQINGTLPEMDNIEIYNLYGEKVYTEKPKGLNTTIDLSDKVRGVYFYKITSNKQVITTGKIVVK